MSSKHKQLVRLRENLAECQAVRPVHAGSTDADYKFRERVHDAINLFLEWMDFGLPDE